MTEHGFMVVLLWSGLAISSTALAVLGVVSYRIFRILERMEGVGAATYLEARKILDQHYRPTPR